MGKKNDAVDDLIAIAGVIAVGAGIVALLKMLDEQNKKNKGGW